MSVFGDLFDGIAPGTSAKLEASRRTRSFAAGSDLFEMGGKPSVMYFIRSGRVKVWRPGRHGAALTLYYLGKGDVPGLVAACRRMRMQVTMTASTEVEVDLWPADVIYRLFDEDARFTHNGLRIVAAALDMLVVRLEDAATANVEQQIGRALLRMAGEHATWTDDHHVAIDVSRQELADLTGSTLYTASRLLSAWDKQGVTASTRGRIIIRKPEELAAIADV